MRVNEDLGHLNRCLDTIPSQLWIYAAQRQLRIFYGQECAAIENLAVLFPTSTALRYKRNSDEKYLYRMSVQYLTRVKRGERRMNDMGLAKRVENELFVGSHILNSSLCTLLKKPKLCKKDFSKIMNGISKDIEGKVCTQFRNSGEISQRRCYWSYKNLFLINSQDFLTYQLLLINKIHHKSLPKNFSISKLILLFWRVLLTTNLGEHAETLCEAFLRYLKINLPEKLIPHISEERNHFGMLRKIAFPSISAYPSYTDNFDVYLEHTKAICIKITKKLFGEATWITPTSFYTEIIYWTDLYASKWINGDIEKDALFNTNTKEYREIIEGIGFLSKHRIW
jgi:hypothetical protein